MYFDIRIVLDAGGNHGDTRLVRAGTVDDGEKKRPADTGDRNLLPIRPHRQSERKRRHGDPIALGRYQPAIRKPDIETSGAGRSNHSQERTKGLQGR